ncbi:hypothetical protein PRZ48_015156 [Zasmidium cellare]|uniref:PiggyBac transposable element-derived protein domain-containing protein n=1 Tax=Zasmidium cellare TaxID=395010 RepID=A0ABR0DXV4_ZASCE|nr:hypothetical protein PRZ48_015156 [Zasmidium cellare]
MNSLNDTHCMACDTKCPWVPDDLIGSGSRCELELDRIATLSTLKGRTGLSSDVLRQLEPVEGVLDEDGSDYDDEEQVDDHEEEDEDSEEKSDDDEEERDADGEKGSDEDENEDRSTDTKLLTPEEFMVEMRRVIRAEQGQATITKFWPPHTQGLVLEPSTAHPWTPLVAEKQEFINLPNGFSIWDECQKWREAGLNTDILPRFLRMICEIKSDDPSCNHKRLMGPSGHLRSPMMISLHYATDSGIDDLYYGLTFSEDSPCLRFVNRKIGLDGCLVNDVVCYRLTREEQHDPTALREMPYKKVLAASTLAAMDRFHNWLVRWCETKVLISWGRIPARKTIATLRPSHYFAVEGGVPIFGKAHHIAAKFGVDGLQDKLLYIVCHPEAFMRGVSQVIGNYDLNLKDILDILVLRTLVVLRGSFRTARHGRARNWAPPSQGFPQRCSRGVQRVEGKRGRA